MPFAAPFEPVHHAIRAAAINADLEPARADDLFSTRSGMEKILSGIAESEVVIADVTGRNANVFYETGVAHTVKDNVVLVAQDIEDVPFDLRHIDLVVYSATPEGLASLTSRLTKTIEGLPRERSTGPAPAKSRLKILHWDGRGNAPYGQGLVIHNVGEDTAEDIVGERLAPTGEYEHSAALGTLATNERAGIILGWTSAPRPSDAPEDVPVGNYLSRVSWTDSTGVRHRTEWTAAARM